MKADPGRIVAVGLAIGAIAVLAVLAWLRTDSAVTGGTAGPLSSAAPPGDLSVAPGGEGDNATERGVPIRKEKAAPLAPGVFPLEQHSGAEPEEQAAAPEPKAAIKPEQEQAPLPAEAPEKARELAPPDYEAEIRGEDLPPALLALLQDAFVEFTLGNIEYAAMLGQDALEISDDYPAVKLMLYGMVGYSYENLGYIDMAIEQYRMALSIYPSHRASYDGMRRLDPEFAATHPALAQPAGIHKKQKGVPIK